MGLVYQDVKELSEIISINVYNWKLTNMGKFKSTKVNSKNENGSKKPVFNNRAKNIGLYKQTLINPANMNYELFILNYLSYLCGKFNKQIK